MNTFVFNLLVSQSFASVRNYVPPTGDAGKFFYLQLDNQIDDNGVNVIKHQMYHTNVYAGSQNEKLELWLSSTEHQMAFF